MRDNKGRFKKGCKIGMETTFQEGHKSGMTGRKHTEKSKLKMSLSHKGKFRPKISMAKKGKPWTQKRRKAKELEKPRQPRQPYKWKNHIKKPVIKNGKEYNSEWHKIRREIYKRDKWICQECNCKCLDKQRKIKGKRIQCHHIDYNEKNNNPDNLITLCASCHAKTSFKRENWVEYYQNKIENLIKL